MWIQNLPDSIIRLRGARVHTYFYVNGFVYVRFHRRLDTARATHITWWIVRRWKGYSHSAQARGTHSLVLSA